MNNMTINFTSDVIITINILENIINKLQFVILQHVLQKHNQFCKNFVFGLRFYQLLSVS